jgi:UDP-glucuronate 4-epimerase
MPKVLITGAAGFIGMHTAIRFLNEGWDVIGLDNFNDYYSIELKRDRVKEIERMAYEFDGKFVLFEADLNSNIWSELKSYNFNAIIHLAAQAGVRFSIENPRAYLESNILGFQSVLDFVRLNRIKSFIYASSSSVYGKDSSSPFQEGEACNNPESYYAASKKCNEIMARSYYNTYGVSSIGLRFFTVYGPWGRPDMAPFLFASAAFNNERIRVFNHGNQHRDFTYVDDIVEGIVRVVEFSKSQNSAKTLNIGNGSPVHLMDFIKKIEYYSKRKLKMEFCDAQVGDVEFTYANTAELERLTGYRPSTSLENGINQFVEWYEKYYSVV